MSKYNFPQIQRIVLRNFSLYSKNGKVCEVDEKINNGVYCLAGANGLGKTTFLNALNYGLTGMVLAPNKEVLSPGEIIKKNKRYTDRYFSGRIKKKYEKDAEIEILLKVKNKYYKIVRGFFEKDSLRSLEVFSKKNKKKIPLMFTSDLSPKGLKELYEKEISKDIGMNNFDYYMFFQLYVLTFDENRRMIFWDDRASSHTLSIAFNTSIKDVEKLIDIKRQMEKHESNGRNARWQATQTKNKLNKLLETKKEKKNQKDAEKEYEQLLCEHEEIEKEYKNIIIEYDTLLKKQSYLNSEIMHIRNEHTKLFSLYSEPRSKLLNNTYVKMSLDKKECLICNAKSNQVIDRVKNNLYKNKCPLCDTSIRDDKKQEQKKLLSVIEKNDKKLAQKNDALENITLEVAGKKLQVDKVEFEFNDVIKKKNEVEKHNPFISSKSTGSESLDYIIKQYKEQFKNHDKEAKEEYEKRDKLIPKYNRLQNDIESAYKEAEFEFVPTFKRLAKSFIGYDLNIKFAKDNKNMKLVLELQGSARTEPFQLSESQRFFLDIALRMSLAIYLSKKDNEATMIIDTPEGSLDIAYESRVGEMFASFINDYSQNILMTANINASQLLISLAEKCGLSKMRFRRMLDWTELSIIQKEGEKLFEKVYSNIELALNGSKNG